MLVNAKNEILVCAKCLPPELRWDDFRERIIAIVQQGGLNTNQTLIYDDLVVGVRKIGEISLVVALHPGRFVPNETEIEEVFKQFETLLDVALQGDFTEASAINRDHYIRIQTLIQREITPDGAMKFTTRSILEDAAVF